MTGERTANQGKSLTTFRLTLTEFISMWDGPVGMIGWAISTAVGAAVAARLTKLARSCSVSN
jgi:hypothetical protein